MPFGLKSAPAKYSRMMSKLLYHCQYFARAYLDDIVIFSDSWSSHLYHIRDVLKHILDACFKLNRTKCIFGCAVIEYLGHRIGHGLVESGQVKVKALLNFNDLTPGNSFSPSSVWPVTSESGYHRTDTSQQDCPT